MRKAKNHFYNRQASDCSQITEHDAAKHAKTEKVEAFCGPYFCIARSEPNPVLPVGRSQLVGLSVAINSITDSRMKTVA